MRNIPLYIMHGQLGAGKTTILTSLIKRPEFHNVRIIENEFAGHSVDSGRLHEDHPELSIYEISGACVCCTGSDTLMTTLIELADKSQEDMPVIIETTGAVDAARLLKSLLLNSAFHERFTLKANILVIDALTAHHKAEHLEHLRADMVLADLVVLTKSDLLAHDEAQGIATRVAHVVGGKLVIADQGSLPEEVTFVNAQSHAADGLVVLADSIAAKDHEELAWMALSLPPCTTEELVESLAEARTQGAEILRVKGTINDLEGKTWRIDGTEYLTESVLADTQSQSPMLVIIGKNLPKKLAV
jgi:G3E family GTPase